MAKIGFSLPMFNYAGALSDATTVARRAEELDYNSLWTFDRLFWATHPQDPYAGTPDKETWPDGFKTVGDPLTLLTAAAAVTDKIELGASVLVFGNYHPVPLARRLATMDVISGGRVKIGFGSGWSRDEHDAVGVDFSQRGKRADEFLDVLKGCLTEGAFAYDGEFFNVPEHIMMNPVQKPHVPIFLAAYAPAALKRAAAKANGWAPAGMPIPQIKEMHQTLLGMVAAAGKDPNDFKMVLRANYSITPQPLKQRFPFFGSLEQFVEDYHAGVEAGADEILFEPMGSDNNHTTDYYLDQLELVKNAIA